MRPAQPVTVNGRTYPSILAAARACGVPHSTFFDRLKKGADPLQRKVAHGRPCEVCGQKYATITALADSMHVSWTTARWLVETSGRFLDE